MRGNALRSRRIAVLLGLVAAGLIVTVAPALAARTCSINSTTSVSFSAYNVFAAANDTSTGGAVKIVCTASGTAVISLTTGGSGSFATRKMSGPGGVTLNYNLYTTSGLATIWGDGSSVGTATVSGTVGTTAVSFTIYGMIPKNQYTAVAGTYNDSITVSVTP
jgi:spore coat protein U-like protein